jgi:hypothetical protein
MLPWLCVAVVTSQVFDLQNGQEVASFQAAADTVNGVHFSPCLPLLATASGHRRYALLPEDGWDTDSAAAAAAAGSEAAKVAAADGSDCAAAAAQGTNAAADLSMGAFQAGSSCNSLWLWRMAADWLPAAVGTEAAERA